MPSKPKRPRRAPPSRVTPEPVTAPRRTRAAYDAERSAATRTRILDAALETLLELGYAKTTTVEIGRRAEVARGTLLHHFPDREALMVAAVRHVLERRLLEFEQEAEALGLTKGPRGAPDADALIDLLWRAIDGGTTVAWVELVVATRNDPVLRAELLRLMEEFDERIAERYVRFMPLAAGLEPPRRLVFAVMNGLVLDRMSGRDAHVPAVLSLLKVAARVSGFGA